MPNKLNLSYYIIYIYSTNLVGSGAGAGLEKYGRAGAGGRGELPLCRIFSVSGAVSGLNRPLTIHSALKPKIWLIL